MSTIRYVIARYRPMIDTGEFANVGIVTFSEDMLDIRYRLAPTKYRRVTQFFDNVPAESYANAVKFLKEEISRIIKFSRSDKAERASVAFSFFTRMREGVITFSEPRTIFGGHIEDVTDQLYNRLIKRVDFGPPTREVSIAQTIRRELRAVNVKSFQARQIRDDIMPVRLPLVSDGFQPAVIKPIAFDQKTTIGILDHAALWHDRFAYFIDRQVLKAERILIPIEGPELSEDDSFDEAFQIARSRISSLPVLTVPLEKESWSSIIEFARRGDAHFGGLH